MAPVRSVRVVLLSALVLGLHVEGLSYRGPGGVTPHFSLAEDFGGSAQARGLLESFEPSAARSAGKPSEKPSARVPPRLRPSPRLPPTLNNRGVLQTGADMWDAADPRTSEKLNSRVVSSRAIEMLSRRPSEPERAQNPSSPHEPDLLRFTSERAQNPSSQSKPQLLRFPSEPQNPNSLSKPALLRFPSELQNPISPSERAHHPSSLSKLQNPSSQSKPQLLRFPSELQNPNSLSKPALLRFPSELQNPISPSEPQLLRFPSKLQNPISPSERAHHPSSLSKLQNPSSQSKPQLLRFPSEPQNPSLVSKLEPAQNPSLPSGPQHPSLSAGVLQTKANMWNVAEPQRQSSRPREEARPRGAPVALGRAHRWSWPQEVPASRWS